MIRNISEEQLEKCREIFNLYDKDKDGTIDSRELGDIMRSLGTYPSYEEINEMLKEVDTDNSGKIDFEEFLELFNKKINELDTEEDYIEAFKTFDKDNSGLITAKNLVHVMASLGERITEEEAEEMIKNADTDGDGTINFKEFCDIITKPPKDNL